MDSSTAADHPDLRPAAHGVARLLRSVRDDRLSGPTPCPEYAVRELLAHLTDLSAAFRDAARKDLGPTTGTDPGAAPPVLRDDWRAVLPRRLDELADAWRQPSAWQGDTQAGGVRLPAAVAGRVALNELLIHGWDLARATGQPYAPEEASLEVSYEMLAPAAEGAGESGDGTDGGGLFGPPVPVPRSAPLLDRVIGLSGRRPDWRPGD
ncbi:TIGR03086 family metal-binding protein [Streptomyces sp. HNM0663]|uniref:TIGR03086 family metal-binding protein n=1 Tax=Streptomyces chengmaiensis TaxID=3040919 RepID=A0ABT6HKG3_9ACTN|nr:TIGR03086 family metal-binding protein [Streptomyces chengmaiensis]MDH2389232.1 TIGR03086 family metal-binding protein [Streptomyces chengmaiensis]